MPILFPAIDLKDGTCVRLVKGEMDQATAYHDNPAEQALIFAGLGFDWLHMVDLNGAFAGESRNGEAVEAIITAVGDRMKVQLGGGIRSLDQIEAWLTKGVTRVILGTIAVQDPDLVRQAARLFPDRVVVGVDARNGRVAVNGWAETSDLTAADLADRFADAGVAAIIYTDIDRDGILTGINWDATIALSEMTNVPVIASGGLASLADIERLTQPDARSLAGAISGRALYDGRIDAKVALDLLGAAS